MRNIAGLLIVPAILVAGCSDGGSTGREQSHRIETAQGIDYENQPSEKSKPEQQIQRVISFETSTGQKEKSTFILDGDGLDWEMVPLLMKAKDDSSSKKSQISITVLRFLEGQEYLWVLMNLENGIEELMDNLWRQKQTSAVAAVLYFDIDSNKATGNTRYSQKNTQGNERMLFLSANTKIVTLEEGTDEKVPYIYYEVMSYSPEATERAKELERKIKKKLTFYREFSDRVAESDSSDQNPKISFSKKWIELVIPLSALGVEAPARIKITLVGSDDPSSGIRGTRFLELKGKYPNESTTAVKH